MIDKFIVNIHVNEKKVNLSIHFVVVVVCVWLCVYEICDIRVQWESNEKNEKKREIEKESEKNETSLCLYQVEFLCVWKVRFRVVSFRLSNVVFFWCLHFPHPSKVNVFVTMFSNGYDSIGRKFHNFMKWFRSRFFFFFLMHWQFDWISFDSQSYCLEQFQFFFFPFFRFYDETPLFVVQPSAVCILIV